MNNTMPTEEDVLSVLRSVIDPEVGMNIVELGLVYNVDITDRKLQVDITMTTPACPMIEMILEDAHATLKALAPKDAEIELNLVWEPPWSPDMMTGYARQHFGWDESVGQAE